MPERYIPRAERGYGWDSLHDDLKWIREFKEKDPAAVVVVGINGSRPNGNTEHAVNLVLRRIEEHGGKTVLINLKEVQMSDEDDAYSQNPESCKYPVASDDDVPDMHELLLLADGFVFGTSTTWAKETPRMSLLTNHLTPLENSGYMLEGKICVFIATAETVGQEAVLQNQLWVTNNMGMSSPPYGTIFVFTGRPRKDGSKAGAIRPAWARQELELAGDNMVKRILSDRFSGIDWDRRHSAEQIRRLQGLLRAVSFERGRLVLRLSQPDLQNGEINP